MFLGTFYKVIRACLLRNILGNLNSNSTDDIKIKKFNSNFKIFKPVYDCVASFNSFLKPELKNYVFGTKTWRKPNRYNDFNKEFRQLCAKSNKHLINKGFNGSKGLKEYPL